MASRALKKGPLELESAQIKETEKDLALLLSSTLPYLLWGSIQVTI